VGGGHEARRGRAGPLERAGRRASRRSLVSVSRLFNHPFLFLLPLFVLCSLSCAFRLLKGHLERLSAALRRRWLTLFPPEVDVLPSTAYPVPLTLQERSNIGGSFLRYKFAFPRPLHVMDLDLGQSVILIGNTPEDRVMRAAFVPSSAPGERGVLEVVAEKNNPEDPSVKILGTLAIGESIQVGAPSPLRSPSPPNPLLPLSHVPPRVLHPPFSGHPGRAADEPSPRTHQQAFDHCFQARHCPRLAIPQRPAPLRGGLFGRLCQRRVGQ